MMKKILLVEQWGSCDAQGKTIGHISKTLKEYVDLLKQDFVLGVMAHQNLLEEIDTDIFSEIHLLDKCICEEGNKSIFFRVIDKIKLFFNIRKAWKQKGYDIIWFFRGDFFVLMYAMIHRKRKGTRYYCLMYSNQYGNGIVAKIINLIYRYGIKRFDGVIYTQEKMSVPHGNKFYMPDYLYKSGVYEKYIALKKEKKVVCVGLMNYDKDIEGTIRIFNEIEYPLEVVGRFLDKNRLIDLKAFAKKNVEIKDVNLSKEEYNYKLGNALFCVIPYKMTAYKGRTSGVLQECMFLETIPIAPKQLLEENGVPGIGYECLEELVTGEIDLLKMSDNRIQIDSILMKQKMVLKKYDLDVLQRKLVKWMCGK